MDDRIIFVFQFGIVPMNDSTDSLDNSTAGVSIRMKKMTRIYDGTTKFPKLEECAHFHYDFVELGPLQVTTHWLPLWVT